MADTARMNEESPRRNLQVPRLAGVHPAWVRLMEYCAELGYGEIQTLKIQDGVPMSAEVTTKKVKFST